MSWTIDIKPHAVKEYKRLDRTTQKRIKKSLDLLISSDNPLVAPNVKALTGNLDGDYRMRVGDWRVLFTPDEDEKVVRVYSILPRGNAYKV